MKQETHLCPHESPRVGLALIFRPGLCVNGQTPARCLHLPESEPLWRAGRGFVVRDLPWTAEKLRAGIFHTFNHKTKDFPSGGKEHPSRGRTRGGAR